MNNFITIKEVIGILLASLLPGVVFGMISAGTGNASEGAWAFPIITMVAIVVGVIIGIPAVIAMNLVKLQGVLAYAALGVLVSVVLALYFIASNLSWDNVRLGWPSYVAQYLVLLVLSLIVTIGYWAVIRPDRIHG